MAQPEQGTRQILDRLLASKGIEEQLVIDDREMAELSEVYHTQLPDTEQEPVTEDLANELCSISMEAGSPRPVLEGRISIADATRLIDTQDVTTMLSAFDALEDLATEKNLSYHAIEVRALAQKLCTIAETHPEREVRIAASTCCSELLDNLIGNR